MRSVQRKPQVTIPVLLVLMLASSAARAEWSTDPYVNNPVDVQAQDAEYADSVPDGSGGLLVFYKQSPDGVGPADVLAQRIDSDGNLVWGAPVMVRDIVDPEFLPFGFRTISDGAGGAFVAMSFYDGNNARIGVQHVTSNGTLAWDPAGVSPVTLTGFNMLHPALVLDGAGGIMIAWEDYYSEASSGVDIYAQRIDAAGNLLWDPVGAHVCSAPSYQSTIHMVRDGEGGCFVTWNDGRDAPSFPVQFGQRLRPDGSAGWAFNGLQLETENVGAQYPKLAAGGPAGGFLMAFVTDLGAVRQISLARYAADGSADWEMFPAPALGISQYNTSIIADGQGGAFVAVEDGRNPAVGGIQLYLQAVSPSGVAKWAPAGVAAGLMNGGQFNTHMTPDGTGGVVAIWEDRRAAGGDSSDLYGQRISNNGARMWGDAAIPVGAGVGSDTGHSVHPDGQGGAFFSFRGERNAGQFDVFAQRVGYHGKLGDARPRITAVTDYPRDQGGAVLLDWDPSYLDDLSHLEIERYTVWSRYGGVGKSAVPDAPALAAQVEQLAKATGLDPQVIGSQLKAGWTMVDQVAAFQRDAYTAFASTHADSSGAGTPMTEFQVLAHGAGAIYWESNIVGGYSVDNLAPGAPSGLAASYQNANGILEWSANAVAVPDLAGYRIYRSDVPGFVPGPASFVAATTDTSYADVNLAAGSWHYLVTAADHADNESAPSNQASLQTAVSGVGDQVPLAFRVRGASPNPFNPTTSIGFSLRAGGQVSIGIFDTRGRLVRRLVDETMGAGSHEATWDGRDDQGRNLPSGVYLARIRSNGEQGVAKMILAK